MKHDNITILTEQAIELLKGLIAIPSFSKEEDKTAALLESFFAANNIQSNRLINNVWAVNKYFITEKPTLLLNSHHDTVKPNKAYTLDPFLPLEKDGKIFGLGSNDAGASLVSLMATFLFFYDRNDLPFNLTLAATAEEEISGKNGIEFLFPQLPKIDAAIVGEPTQMQMAVAERGLLVLDCTANGIAGHAARNEGENALYKAMDDIQWIRNTRFPKVSELLGEVKMTATVIETTNKAHNVVPAECSFVVDVRVNELYTLEEVYEHIAAHLQSEVKPRSFRMRSSGICMDHPLVKSGLALDKTYYGSPTTSDKALIPVPTLKIGPGDSARSHTADEFIYKEEIANGILDYISLLNHINF